MFKYMLAATCLALATIMPASAVGPIAVETVVPQRTITYSASVTGLVPASSATDFLTLTAPGTKHVTLKFLYCDGTSTAAGSGLVNLLRRSTLDTGGTSTTVAATPHESTDPAATAVVTAYTANPTLGTAVGTPIRVARLLTTVSTSPALFDNVTWNFGQSNDKSPGVQLGSTEVLALNANAAGFAAGTILNCSLEWTE